MSNHELDDHCEFGGCQRGKLRARIQELEVLEAEWRQAFDDAYELKARAETRIAALEALLREARMAIVADPWTNHPDETVLINNIDTALSNRTDNAKD